MSVEGWPIENAGAVVNARDYRRLFEAFGASRGVSAGVTTFAALQVTQRGAGANMSVDVAAGGAVIDGSENTHQGHYHFYVDAVENLVIAAADATYPRIDLVVAKIEDSEYSGATDAGSLAVVAGTPAASPAEPAAPANSLVLAAVAVAAGATSVVNANITDRRARFGRPPAVSAYKTTNTNVPDAAWTTLGLDTEYWDTHGFHGLVNSRLTIPAGFDGLYACDAQINFDGSTGGSSRSMAVLIDGWLRVVLEQVPPSAAATVLGAPVPGGLRLAAGQYVELQAKQNSGGVLAISSRWLALTWLGPSAP